MLFHALGTEPVAFRCNENSDALKVEPLDLTI